MRTFKMTLSYDGTSYCGWQVQVNGPSIQQFVERALAQVVQARVRVTASGRTDAGVHAFGQVASFAVETALPLDRLRRALNGSLPPDIRVQNVEEVAEGFHAVRDAIRKRYRYVYWDDEIHDVFERNYSWHVRRRLDIESMREALAYLTGRHDFRSFQSAGSPRATTERTIFEATIARQDQSPKVHLEIEADGFLYNMMRNIAGTLVRVGKGDAIPGWVPEVLRHKDRRQAGPTAPPEGLFLLWVRYRDAGQGRSGGEGG